MDIDDDEDADLLGHVLRVFICLLSCQSVRDCYLIFMKRHCYVASHLSFRKMFFVVVGPVLFILLICILSLYVLSVMCLHVFIFLINDLTCKTNRAVVLCFVLPTPPCGVGRGEALI